MAIPLLTNTRLHGWVILAFSMLLYANTLSHDYTQDDAIVITDNMFTTQGISGIPGLLAYDTFYGFFKQEGKARLVAGGRYRPLTPVMFAVEWAIFGKSPLVSHFINILLFGFTCLLLYRLMLALLGDNAGAGYVRFVAFGTAILFAAHPVHTEAVANIKGRDEIMALLLSLAAMYLTVRAFSERKWTWSVAAAVVFFLGLLSKENTITFLAVIPMSLMVFRKASLMKSLVRTLPLMLATLLFLFIRGSILGWQVGDEPMELMNNPFVKVAGDRYVPFSGEERFATIVYTLGRYVQLLFFPHPLTHDYYPRHIGIMHLADWQVLLSLAVYLALTVYAIVRFFKNDHVAFGIWFYLLTLSIVSNLFFPVGTNMSERFLFMPSVGFCIAVAVSLWRLQLAVDSKRQSLLAWGVLLVIVLAFSAKTFSRNFVWKDNYTLFSTDVRTSANSAKLRNAAAGELLNQAQGVRDEAQRDRMINEAIGHLEVALRIHPNYKNAHLLLGNAYNYRREFEKSIESYQRALQLDPEFADAQNNIAQTYRDAGRYYGEEKGNLPKSLEYLTKAYELRPTDYETLRLLGVANGIGGNAAKAVEFFTKAVEVQPDNADAIYMLGNAYFNAGDAVQGKANHDKALAIDPEVAKRMKQK
jgi:tetratricopeptide (TPR) repeat protein